MQIYFFILIICIVLIFVLFFLCYHFLWPLYLALEKSPATSGSSPALDKTAPPAPEAEMPIPSQPILKDYSATKKYQEALIALLCQPDLLKPELDVTGVKDYGKAFTVFFYVLQNSHPTPEEKEYFTTLFISKSASLLFENEFELDWLKAVIRYWTDYQKAGMHNRHFESIVHQLAAALKKIAQVPKYNSYLKKFVCNDGKLINPVAPSSSELDLYIVRRKVLLIAELLQWHIQYVASTEDVAGQLNQLNPKLTEFIMHKKSQ